MKIKPLVWIVVPVFDRIDHISHLVDLLKEQTYENYNLVIVDHGKKKIQKNFGDKVELIMASPDLWWTGAINKGIKHILENKNVESTSPILIINDDVTFDKKYLLNLISDWGNDENVIMGSLCIESGSSKVLYANIMLNKIKAKFEYKHRFEDVEKINERLLSSDLLSGRGTIIPVKIFYDIGLYNETALPHYKADYELVYRAKKNGYEAYVSTNSIVYTIMDSPHKLDNKDKLKSMHSVLFGRKSVLNLKDLRNYSFLNFNSFYGTYYLLINLLRYIGYIIKKLYFI